MRCSEMPTAAFTCTTQRPAPCVQPRGLPCVLMPAQSSSSTWSLGSVDGCLLIGGWRHGSHVPELEGLRRPDRLHLSWPRPAAVADAHCAASCGGRCSLYFHTGGLPPWAADAFDTVQTHSALAVSAVRDSQVAGILRYRPWQCLPVRPTTDYLPYALVTVSLLCSDAIWMAVRPGGSVVTETTAMAPRET